MDKYYQVELALCDAVEKRRNFHHCAEMISAIFAPLSNFSEAAPVMDNLIEFLNTYRPSPGG